MHLTSKQRKHLTGIGHGLSPVVYIGKNGLTDEVTAAADKALEDHELVKIRFVDFKKSKDDITRDIAASTGSVVVRVLGNTALVYRRNRDPDKRVITLP